jgi:hypothetical protein
MQITNRVPRLRFGTGRLTTAYLKCLADPWNNPPVRTGFGSGVPTSLTTAYLRTSLTLGTSNTFLVMNPAQIFAASTAGTSDSFFTTWTSASASGLISGMAATSYAASNSTTINSVGDYFRPIAASLRINIWVPPGASTSPGYMYVGQINASTTNFAASSILNMVSNPNLKLAANTGIATTATLTWRPIDPSSFTFSPPNSAVVDATSGLLVVSHTSAGGGPTVQVEMLAHLESIAGNDVWQDEPGPTVASEGTTVDTILTLASRLPSTTNAFNPISAMQPAAALLGAAAARAMAG